ncbi:MAG TPA: hypothetical protein VF980_07535 [Thermoanaerobaculia bacterium]
MGKPLVDCAKPFRTSSSLMNSASGERYTRPSSTITQDVPIVQVRNATAFCGSMTWIPASRTSDCTPRCSTMMVDGPAMRTTRYIGAAANDWIAKRRTKEKT